MDVEIIDNTVKFQTASGYIVLIEEEEYLLLLESVNY